MAIRTLPQDFTVEERLTPEFAASLAVGPSPAHPVAIYRLDKQSLTTPDACAGLARALGLAPGRVTWAGLKDKHAKTHQHVGALGLDQFPTPAPGSLQGRGWFARLVGWAPRAPDAADILANHFEITIRDLTPESVALLESRARELAAAGGLLLANYFGAQRFVSARHGQGFAGSALARGDFAEAVRLLIAAPARKDVGPRRIVTRLAAQHWGRWDDLREALRSDPRAAPSAVPEARALSVLLGGGSAMEAFAALPHLTQSFAVEAFQSHLWNRTVASMIQAHAASLGREALIALDDFGPLAFLPARDLPTDWLGWSVPMLSSQSVPGKPWGEHAKAVLAGEGLTLGQLRVQGLRRPKFEHVPRPLMVEAQGFALSPSEPDPLAAAGSGRLLVRARFALRRGSYATVVLRAIGA